MNIVQRVRNLILQPNDEWRVIDLETHEPKALTKSWLVPLAALSALATLIGAMVWGFSIGPITVRSGLGDALVQAVLAFVAAIGMAWLVAWIIDALAPTFGGTKRFDRAFAVSAFAMTGSLVGGMAQILPFFATLIGLAGGIWSLVLLYKGLPILMKSPPDRALAYTAVVVVAAIICNIVIITVLSRFGPSAPAVLGSGLPGTSSVTVQTPGGAVTTTAGALEAAGRHVEAASRQAQQASQQSDPQGVAKAATDALAAFAAATPGGNRTPIPVDILKGWLPERIAGMVRERFEVQGGTAVGVAGSTASASYRDGTRRIDVEVLDAGGASGLLAMIGGLQSGERETDTLVERSFQQDRRRVTEKRWKHAQRGEMSVILGNGVLVSLKGEGVDLAALQAFAGALKLERLEAVPTAAKG